MARELYEIIPQIISKHTPLETKAPSLESMAFKQLNFIHSTSDGESRTLGYRLESRGTQVFLALLLPALEALSEGSFLVIDELDTSLHPDLSRAFLSLFHRETSNPHGAQLLFSTHDVTLLDSDVLQQDEIWFTDKDPDGASRLTPLTDFKLPPPGQLRHGDIEQAYRLGRFGGMPNSRGHLEKLPFPPHGEACWSTRNPSTTDCLMVRRQSSGGLCPIFRGAPGNFWLSLTQTKGRRRNETP